MLLRRLVTTPEDTSISGASVTVCASRYILAWEFSHSVVLDTTGTNGPFELQPYVGLRTWLDARSPGFASLDEWMDLETRGIREKYYRVPQASGSIEGRVFDEAGDPTPGVFVGVTLPQVYSGHRGHSVSPQTTRSEKSGYYELKPLPAGQVSLTFLNPGYFPTGTVFVLEDGKVHRLDIRLREVRTVPIRVENRRGQWLSSNAIKMESGFAFPTDDQGMVHAQNGQVGTSLVSPDGGTGRRTRLKIWRVVTPMWVRVPLRGSNLVLIRKSVSTWEILINDAFLSTEFVIAICQSISRKQKQPNDLQKTEGLNNASKPGKPASALRSLA